MNFKLQMEKTNISSRTIDIYYSAYLKMLKKLKIDEKELFKVENIKLLEYHLNTFKELGTKMTTLCMMIKYCDLNDIENKCEIVKILKKRFKEIRKEKDKYYGKLTDNKKNNWVSWKKLQEVLQKSKDKFYSYNWEFWKDRGDYRMPMKQVVRETMILSMYLESEKNPPRRIKDYSRMRLAPLGVKSNELDPRFNWCSLYEKKFIFNDYKTSKTYKTQMVTINDKTLEYIRMYVEVWNVDNYFFKSSKNADKPMSDAYLSHLIGDTLIKYGSKRLGASMLRNIFASNLLKDAPIKNYINEIAYKMGTSRDMIMDIYRQNVDENGELID